MMNSMSRRHSIAPRLMVASYDASARRVEVELLHLIERIIGRITLEAMRPR